LELELDSGLSSEPAKLQQRIRQLFGLVRTSLAEELNGGNGHSNTTKLATEDGSQPSAGNGHSTGTAQRAGQPRAATTSQVKALYAITKSQGQDLNQLLRERFHVDKPDRLSIREASQLIGELKGTSKEGG
jgi:hypothetical protein